MTTLKNLAKIYLHYLWMFVFTFAICCGPFIVGLVFLVGLLVDIQNAPEGFAGWWDMFLLLEFIMLAISPFIALVIVLQFLWVIFRAKLPMSLTLRQKPKILQRLSRAWNLLHQNQSIDLRRKKLRKMLDELSESESP